MNIILRKKEKKVRNLKIQGSCHVIDRQSRKFDWCVGRFDGCEIS